MFKDFLGFVIIVWLMCTSSLYSQSLHLLAIGNTQNETRIIDSLNYKKSFPDYSSLQNELAFIKKQLHTIGYIEKEQVAFKKQNDSTYLVQFNLNKHYKTITIYYFGIIDKNILKLVSDEVTDQHFRVSIDKLERTLQLLNSEISNQGDPFSAVQLNNIIKKENNSLSADLLISNQIKREIDSIIVKGYEKFPKSYLKRYLKLKPKQIFNLDKIKQKTENLNELQFASQIKEPEVLFTKDSTLLYIYIEEVKSNTFDGFLGFGTNTETGKLEFNGYLNLNLTNNLNYGESFRLKYKSDENDQKTFDIQASLPYILGSPIGVELELNIFKKDTTFVTITQAAKLNYQINQKTQVSAGIGSVNSSDLLNLNTSTVNDFNSKYYIFNYRHIKTQKYDALFPVTFYIDFTTSFGKRNHNTTEESQTKFKLNTFKIFNLNNKNSLYFNIDAAFINSNTYLDNELFRFGGINSIRGFEENSLVADLYSVLNTEYRYRLNNSLYIHTVFDAAYLENKNALTKEKLFGFGFGFGLLTKAGLFKLNYSSGKTPNQKFKFSDSKIHISLTTRF